MLKCILVALLISSVMSAAANTKQALYFPRAEAIRDQRTLFPVLLLENILNHQQKTFAFELKPTHYQVNQQQALTLLDMGRIHVVWSGESEQRKQNYRAIEIPILKGYLGWRVMLVNAKQSNLLQNISSLQQLKQYSLLSGHDWPELERYRKLGFQVVTEESYETLFSSLAMGKADLFPRSVMEIWQESQTYQHLGLNIEPDVLVKYPYALYFYVSKSNRELAARIEYGFNKIIQTGLYEDLFQQTFGEQLKNLNLAARRVIDLPGDE